MALVSLGLPVYNATEEDDLELFISLYLGYIASVNVNYQDHVGNPAGSKRAIGILRSCMQGSAAIWFDRELTGKNWRLTNMNKNVDQVNANHPLNALRALNVQQAVVGGMGAGTYVAGSPAAVYSALPANNAVTIGVAFIPSIDALTGQASRNASLAWDRIGAEPVIVAPNPPSNNVGGNGNPIVFEGIEIGQAFYWMRKHLPAMQDERRRLRFSSIYQDNLPIKDYYERISRAGQLLNFGDELINDQFFRGLTPDNSVEIERIGMEKPVDELVRILERVEKRKAEVFLGFNSRKALEEHRLKKVEPVQAPPPTRQEPVEIKPVASHAITKDMLDKLLQHHTENLTKNFQTQLQAIQEEKVTQPSSQPAPSFGQPVQQKYRPPIPPKDHRQIHEYYERDNPFDNDRDWNREENMQHLFDIANTSGSRVKSIVHRVARKLAQAEERRQDRELVRAMQGLGLGDQEDGEAMDVDMICVGDSLVSQDDLNEYFANLLRSKKK
jgi:hypothetical protein